MGTTVNGTETDAAGGRSTELASRFKENSGPEAGHWSRNAGETPGANCPPPAKLALKSWIPPASAPVLIVATPFPSVAAVPKITPLSRKVIVPAGPSCCELTCAVSVCVLSDGFVCELSATTGTTAEAGAGDTVIAAGADTLPAKGPLALNAAVTECIPVARDAVLKLALPLELMPTVPSTAAPL
jgi:hypothetical protein